MLTTRTITTRQARKQGLVPKHSGRFIVHPPAGPRGGIDLTERVVGVIADELWKRHGGNDVLNWIEAERLLIQALLSGTELTEPQQ